MQSERNSVILFILNPVGKRGLKRVDKIGEQMIKSRLLHSKQTRYGLEVSLEHTRKEILIGILKNVFPDDGYL